MILASVWNQIVARVRATSPLSGLGVEVSLTPAGSLVSANPSARFDHPWKFSARWEDEQWRVSVRPGFVNGLDATITMNREKGDPVEVGLTDEDRPYLTPAWRNPIASAGVTASGSGELIQLPGEGYPPFFKTLGVRPADAGSRAEAKQTYTEQVSNENRTRELRACDIALITPRVATSQHIDILSPTIDSQSFMISTVFQNAYARSAKSKYRLVSVPKWTPPQEPTAMDKFMGTAVEPQTDEIKIGTLWMVSPENPEDGEDAVPDGSWVPYPQYNVFWNLAHASQRAVPKAPPTPITLHTGLAGGIADSIFAQLLAPSNDSYMQAMAFLNSTTFKGAFWTI